MNKKDDIIANLIANTGRIKRRLSIIQISALIKEYLNHFGSLKKLSEEIQISTGMLRKFMLVDKLSDKTKQFIDRREIDSVEMINSLSQLTPTEQDAVVEEIINGNLNSQDLRALTPLKQKFSDVDINSLIDNIIASKTKKISVIKFHFGEKFNLSKFKKRIDELIGKEDVIDLSVYDGNGTLKITKKGEKVLREHAKSNRKSLSDFLIQLINSSYVKRP